MATLPTQEFKVYSEIPYNEIVYLYDYHPWYRNGEKSPHIDQVTHDILNIKNSHPDKVEYRHKAVRFFNQALTSINPQGLLSALPANEDRVFSIVPSSTAFRVSIGLSELIQSIHAKFNFKNNENPLVRHKTVPKAATGGLRDQQIHLDSIKASSGIVQGKVVYLFDDVTTTGCSLLACKSLLLLAGASQVVMIALGKTCQD